MTGKFPLPPGLSPITIKVIEDAEEQLRDKGTIDSIDGGAFYMMAHAFESFIQASADVAQRGSTLIGSHGGETSNPNVRIANDACKLYFAICKDFGLTPASRGRIKETAKATEDSPLDILANQLK